MIQNSITTVQTFLTFDTNFFCHVYNKKLSMQLVKSKDAIFLITHDVGHINEPFHYKIYNFYASNLSRRETEYTYSFIETVYNTKGRTSSHFKYPKQYFELTTYG